MKDLIDKNKKKSIFIEDITSNQKKFNDFIYTPIDEALKEIEARQSDERLNKCIKSLIDIPNIMEGKTKGVLIRNVITPNYETELFIEKVLTWKEQLEPLFLEYTEDKFVDKNESKFALGKISIYKGKNKKNEPIFEFKSIIDFHTSNGKSISSIKTFWNQFLIDFHHEFFLNNFPHFKNNVFDFSAWFQENGNFAKEYYKLLLLFFIKHGILFENFMLKNTELCFTKNVVLPAFLEILEETGLRPLIVELEPTKEEENKIWQAYPPEMKEYLDKKFNKKN
ncbi:MAG: hypothetical protein V1910_00415 [bacterium]